MSLVPSRRDLLAERTLRALSDAEPESVALLRGSLAEGRADPYSDIDILWEVPDERFEECVERAGSVLRGVRAVESIREDPDLQGSSRRRLFFVRFAGVPLFWRLDLEVLARSLGREPEREPGSVRPWGSSQLAAESALSNAVAAVKSLLRGDKEGARGLLVRAYGRVGLPVPEAPPEEMVRDLAARITEMEPETGDPACRVEKLCEDVFA
jgi:predicted nucleotidyltransferase